MRVKLFLILLVIVPTFANERIITLSPAINEVVFALNKGSSVIANTDQARYPKVSQSLPKVGGFFGISIEKVLSLNPTLILMQKNNSYLVTKFNRYHIPTIVFSISSLESIQSMIQTLGIKLSAQTKANQILQDIEMALTRLAHPSRNKTVLMIFGASADLKRPMYCAGRNLYFNELIEKAGYHNAVNLHKTTTIGLEKLLSINPDIIIIADSSITKEESSSLLSKWKLLPLKAAKLNQIYIFNKVYQTMPSHRIVNFINDLGTVLQ